MIAISLTGLEDILTRLNKLDRKMQQTIIVDAVKRAAAPTLRKAANLAPKRTGALSRGLGVKYYRKRGTFKVTIGAGAKKGLAYIGPVELGHYSGRRQKLGKVDYDLRRKIPPTKFLRRAYLQDKNKILAEVGNRIRRALDWSR